jgi:hypothetical protein
MRVTSNAKKEVSKVSKATPVSLLREIPTQDKRSGPHMTGFLGLTKHSATQKPEEFSDKSVKTFSQGRPTLDRVRVLKYRVQGGK